MPRKPKRIKYNLHVEVYPVEYSDISEGYEPVQKARSLVRYNFILPGPMQRGYIIQQIRGFVKDLENGTAAYTVKGEYKP